MRCVLFKEDRLRWSLETEAVIAQETYRRLGWSIDVEGKPITTNATPPPTNVGNNDRTTPTTRGQHVAWSLGTSFEGPLLDGNQ